MIIATQRKTVLKSESKEKLFTFNCGHALFLGQTWAISRFFQVTNHLQMIDYFVIHTVILANSFGNSPCHYDFSLVIYTCYVVFVALKNDYYFSFITNVFIFTHFTWYIERSEY